MEVMVGLLVFAVLAVCATLITASITKLVYRANQLAELNSLFDILSRPVISDMQKGGDNYYVGDESGVPGERGYLCLRNDPYYDIAQYRGKTMRMSITGNNVTFTLYLGTQELASRTYTVWRLT
jgi:hypothetical protein